MSVPFAQRSLVGDWVKTTAHEKDVYRKAVIEFNDVSSEQYDTFTLEKAFVVDYSQSFDGEKGEGEFFILLRSLDNMEEVFGERWNPKGSVTAPDELMPLASTPNPLLTAQEYQEWLNKLNLNQLMQLYTSLSLATNDIIGAGFLNQNTKLQMIQKEINKRNSADASGSQLITSQMMKDFGWAVSDTELTKINDMLIHYKITDMRSIRLFMATCGHESGKGRNVLEGLKKDGTTMGNYEPEERGAGYIQVTHRTTQLEFLSTIPDSFDGVETAKYIAENYPWEAAGWFWSNKEAKSAGRTSINNYVVKYGDSKGVYLIIQYLVNSWKTELNAHNYSFDIRDGKVSWEIKDGELYVEGKYICNAPLGWNDREENYNDAFKSFK